MNTKSDKIAEIATNHKEWVVIWFKRVCEFMCKQKGGTIKATEAISLAQQTTGAKIKGSEVEKVLDELVKEKWLYEGDRSGYYTAGVRTLMELAELLQEFGAIECPISLKVVIPTKKYRVWLKANNGVMPKNKAVESDSEGQEEASADEAEEF